MKQKHHDDGDAADGVEARLMVASGGEDGGRGWRHSKLPSDFNAAAVRRLGANPFPGFGHFARRHVFPACGPGRHKRHQRERLPARCAPAHEN